jgi:hypothetical protein
VRALKYARVPGVTVAMACAKYHLTRSAFYRARAELAGEAAWTLDDLLLSALSRRRPQRAADLIEYIDWLDHTRYRPAELTKELRRLESKGLVARTSQGWVRRRPWP